jgi:acyl-CoA synthetase (AMP-forming)/AMP-acid ligase II
VYPIEFFFRSARRNPGAVALETAREALTYGELAHRVRELAAAMQAADPAPQSRVGICAANNVGHIVALLATLAAGKVWVPLNPRAVREELDRIVAFTGPSLLIADESV